LATELTEHEQKVQRSSGCRASLMLPLLRGTDQEGVGVLVFQRDTPLLSAKPTSRWRSPSLTRR